MQGKKKQNNRGLVRTDKEPTGTWLSGLLCLSTEVVSGIQLKSKQMPLKAWDMLQNSSLVGLAALIFV